MSDLDSKRLEELLDYNPETGIFTRKIGTGGQKAGAIAGYKRPDGYIRIMINNKSFLAHRLAWLYTHQEWPKGIIDHKNNIRHDNFLSNLRDTNQSINLQNQTKPSSRNKSGFLGVSWSKTMNKWQSQICENRTLHHLGYFKTPEEAHDAYLLKKKELHPIAFL